MAIRVAHWATGVTGREALRTIIEHPELELVALYVSDPGKAGKDAAELCGLDKVTGISATGDVQAIFDAEPQCLCYAAKAAGREEEAVADMSQFLSAGIDVVTFALISMVYPPAAPESIRESLEKACAEGGSSFFATGSSPGFFTLGLVSAALSAAGRVDALRMQEFVNVQRYGVPEAMRDTVGMGMPADYVPLRVTYGITERWWGPLLHHAAKLLGEELRDVTFEWETAVTDKDLETDFGPVPKGTIGAYRWSLRGVIGKDTPLILEQFMRADNSVAPDWPQRPVEAGHSAVRIQIEGRPSQTIDFHIDFMEDDKVDCSIIQTATHTVNAIPVLVEANAGIYGPDDLPVYSTKNLG